MQIGPVGLLGLALAGIVSAESADADTLEAVRSRGALRCGIIEGSPGYSTIDDRGERHGIEIDNCKTVSAAVFGAIRVEYVPIAPHTAFTLLQSGSIDLISGGTTWTFSRDTGLGLDYGGVYFFAAQGFLVRRDSGVRAVADLDGATICASQGTTLELNLADYFHAHGWRFETITFANLDEAAHAYRADRCDAYTNEIASAAGRIANWPDRDEHVILDGVISREPMAPMVRQDDPRWRDIVTWAYNVRVIAEELRISQRNVDSVRATTRSPDARQLLGIDVDLGAALGLAPEWAYHVVKLVGNYADVWERNFAPLGLSREINAPWTHGGKLVSLPVR